MSDQHWEDELKNRLQGFESAPAPDAFRAITKASNGSWWAANRVILAGVVLLLIFLSVMYIAFGPAITGQGNALANAAAKQLRKGYGLEAPLAANTVPATQRLATTPGTTALVIEPDGTLNPQPGNQPANKQPNAAMAEPEQPVPTTGTATRNVQPALQNEPDTQRVTTTAVRPETPKTATEAKLPIDRTARDTERQPTLTNKAIATGNEAGNALANAPQSIPANGEAPTTFVTAGSRQRPLVLLPLEPLTLTWQTAGVELGQVPQSVAYPVPETIAPTTPPKHTVYVQLMPTFGYSRIKANQQDDFVIQDIEGPGTFSLERLGLRAEAGVGWQLSPRWQVYAGGLLFIRQQDINYDAAYFVGNEVAPGNDGNTFDVLPDFDTAQFKFQDRVRNFGVQLGVNYTISNRTWRHLVGASIEMQRPLNPNDAPNEAQGFTSVPSLYTFSNFYYRVERTLGPHFTFYTQPTLNYTLYINENFNAPFYVKPYGFGVNVGVTYRFR